VTYAANGTFKVNGALSNEPAFEAVTPSPTKPVTTRPAPPRPWSSTMPPP
jgi:hypothetical protein